MSYSEAKAAAREAQRNINERENPALRNLAAAIVALAGAIETDTANLERQLNAIASDVISNR